MSTITALTDINPQDAAALQEVQQMYSDMQKALSSMGTTFDALGSQTAQAATLAPALEATQQIQRLREHMLASEKKQDARIDEVVGLLREVVQDQIIDHLKEQVKVQMAEVIDAMVEQGVAEQLKLYAPESLQATLIEQKRQIAEVRQALHNSESRRANSLLRSNHLHDPLHTLLTREGKVSKNFPRDLTALFALDAPTAQSLLVEYGLADAGPSRERCLNSFMQFLGVAYQLVPTNKP